MPRARRKVVNGVTLGPKSPLATLDVRRPERVEQADCDAHVLTLGGEVVQFSQARASMQTEGIPDRRYRLMGPGTWHGLWFEVKPEKGKLTKSQYDFLMHELACGSLAACGGLAELKRVLPLLGHADSELAHTECLRTVNRWAARGYRPEPKRRGGRPRGARRLW